MNEAAAKVLSAQTLLQGPWKHAKAARDACRAGNWQDFAISIAPPRPFLCGRADYRRCLALATTAARGPELRTLTIVPLWACGTGEEPASEWIAIHGISQAGEKLYPQESGPFIGVADAEPRVDALWVCTVRRWRAAVVAHSWAYSPEIPLLLRAGKYAAIEVAIDEVVAVDEQICARRERPNREVPAFASWFEQRVEVGESLAMEIEALNFTASDE
jgi:hypothetical protein